MLRFWLLGSILSFLFVIISFVIIITMSLLAMLLSKNMIADGCALSLLQVCIACAVACPNTIIELTMAVRRCKWDNKHCVNPTASIGWFRRVVASWNPPKGRSSVMLLVLLFHKTMEPPFEGFHLAITFSFSHPSSMRIKEIARKSWCVWKIGLTPIFINGA